MFALTISAYQNNNTASVSTDSILELLKISNVQAEITQPDTSGCLGPASCDCISLHPTDPSKDITVKNSYWA